MPKLVLIGCGAVGQALLEMIPLFPDLPEPLLGRPGAVIIEPKPIPRLSILRRRVAVSEHRRVALTPENLTAELGSVLQEGDFVVDVSVNVDAISVMEVCLARNCTYVNTSLEDWEVSHPERLRTSPVALERRSLFARLAEAERRLGGRRRHGRPTMIVDHGMNPGLITHFALRGMADYAAHVGDQVALRHHSRGRFSECAERLGLRVVHVSERDTQRPKVGAVGDRDTFYNTWSVEGFAAEARDPVQIGYGAHEPRVSDGSRFVAPPSVGDDANVRLLPVRGMDVKAWSYCPSRDGHVGPIRGRCIPHGEANTLSSFLTNAATGYRPSVYYVYQTSPVAERSLEELRDRGYVLQPNRRVLGLEDIETGYDAVGALLWFRNPRNETAAWWCGTIVGTKDAREMGFVRAGPTTVQVAASILAALSYTALHPRRGLITPEDLPHEDILARAAPFLGKLASRLIPFDDRKHPVSDLTFADFSLRLPENAGSRQTAPRKT